MPQRASDPWLSALDQVQEAKGDPWLAALDAVKAPAPDTRSVVSRAFDTVFTPPRAVTHAATAAADAIDAPSLTRSPFRASVEGFAAGAVEGAASLLTPGDVALTATGFGPLARVIRGVRGGQQAVATAQRLANAATVVRGGERALDADSLTEAATGIGQAALGGVGLRGSRPAPAPAPVPRRALPPGPRFVATPDGVVAPAGTDIPMTQAPDGSFVRGVPAEYARRDIRGLLTAGREPIITPPPAGAVPDMADPSFVRSVPAEYARHEIRGELPPGPRFHADASGNVATADRADELLAALDEIQARAPSESSVQSVRPAVMARDIDTTQPTNKAITVRQYSSDPAAVDAPLLSDDDLRMLRVMREDLAVFTPQRGRLIRDPNDPNSSIYAHGGAGSPVGDDIRVISRQHVGNDKIAAAIDDLIAGKAPTNKLHLAAIDAVRGYAEGRSGYRGPQLPMEGADPGSVGAVAAREPVSVRPAVAPMERVAKMAESNRGAEALEELQRLSGGAGARASGSYGLAPRKGHIAGQRNEAIDDFDTFSQMFDDIEPGALGTEGGEGGFITPALSARLGGGALGGVVGAASGDEDEGTLKRAARIGLGMAAGAAAPSLFRRPGATPFSGSRGVSAPTPSVFQQMTGQAPGQRGRAGRPKADPMEGMDPFIGKFNPLVQAGIRERIVANGGYDVQRRGVIDTETLGRFADEVRIHAEKTLPKGTALNAETLTAYARAVQQTQAKITTLAERVNAGTATDAEIVALQAAKVDADVLTKSLAGARSEAGRSLAAFRFLGGVLETGDVTLIRGVADSMRDEARALAKGLADQPNDPLVRYRWLQAQGKPTLWAKARSVYYANILSGVKTHERNILGNVANIASELAVTPAAAAADAVRSAVKGTPRTVYLDEMPAGVVGAIGGMERGWADMWFTLREGVSPDSLRRSVASGELGKLDIPRVEFGGGAANPFNWPGRALDGADTFFRSIARNGELYRLSHTQAKGEGLTGERFVERVADLRSGLAPDAPIFQEQAAEYARRSVFQEKPGKIASWVLQGHQVPVVGHVMPFVLPFVKTPANIFRQGLEFSPAGVLMKAARQGGRAGAQAQGRAVVGSLAAGYLAWLAATGRLSGNGPRDPADRAALMESGWRPNSVRIGDSWVNYQLFQPVSVQAALISNAFEAWQQGGASLEDAPDLIAQTLARSANSFLDQSFFSGMFDFVEAIRDSERSAGRMAARTAQGAVPFIGAVRTAQQAMDPVVRQPKGTAETFMSALPVLSERVQPRIGQFGQEIVREGGPLRRAADPFNVSSVVQDPVGDELLRLGVSVGLPSNVVQGATLTRDQRTEVQQRRGEAVRAALDRLVSSRAYTRMTTDEQRIDAIEEAIERARHFESLAIRRDLRRDRLQKGLVTPGNIDLYAQPVVPNPDGTTSTVDSFSVNIDGREVLLPTVTPDGRHLSEDAAIREYEQTGRHLGIFDTPANATGYASQLHTDYAAGKYSRRPSGFARVPLSGPPVVPRSVFQQMQGTSP